MRIVFTIIASFNLLSLHGQDQTLGLFVNDSLSYDGYTLFFPSSSKNTYLIDNCGYLINEWESEFIPGLAVYLLEDGSILRTGRIFSSFAAGGNGGHLEKRAWDNTLLWSFDYTSPTFHQHHDIAPLPNGNILVLAWERVPTESVILAGRNPASIGSNGVWYEKVVELKPVGSDFAQVVWEWKLFDHLVQDLDSTKLNFGSISENPEKLDINYNTFENNIPGNPDWVHFNSIDYNADLDQILLSSRNLNEIFIIDHSTSSLEASQSEGGNSGKGGDFLYRWGNPAVYGRGLDEDQKLFGQHDAHWIPSGRPDEGKIMIFNNGEERPDGDYSSVDIITPPLDNNNNYQINEQLPYGPDELHFSFRGEGNSSFYSRRVSGASQLKNGNLLICSGNSYRIFEIDASESIVWDYINPVDNNGPLTQGEQSFNRDLFRAYRYSPDYKAFEDKDMTPQNRIELDPIDDDCVIYGQTTSVDNPIFNTLKVSPNPAVSTLFINGIESATQQIIIRDLRGRVHLNEQNYQSNTIDISILERGFYLLQIITAENKIPVTLKFVKV